MELTQILDIILLLSGFILSSEAAATARKVNIFHWGGGTPGENGGNERELYWRLMTNYSRHVRPTLTVNETVQVEIRLSFAQLLDVDEKNQVLTSEVWMNQIWDDHYLQWDADEYRGLDFLVMTSERIWLPDLYVQNSVGDTEAPLDNYASETAQVYPSGEVVRVPWYLLKTHCVLDISFFPYDDQVCPIIVGSWSHPSKYLNISTSLPAATIEKSVQNNEWDIIDIRASRKIIDYECCPHQYVEIHYEVHLKRKPLFYIINIMLPSIMLHVMSTFIFLVPADAGERISFGLTTFLSHSVFSLLVAERVPESSNSVPIISQYLSIAMLSNLVAVLWSVYVVRAWCRPGEVSKGLARACKYIAPSLGLNKKIYLCSCEEKKAPPEPTDGGGGGGLGDVGASTNGRTMYKECSTTTDEEVMIALNGKKCGSSGVPPTRFQACDWHLVLDVLDRIILFVFCIVMISAISILFIILPYIYGKIFT